MFWARERERKDKIEWMAANIFVKVVTTQHGEESFWYDLTTDQEINEAFVIAEAFVNEAERRAK